MPENKVLCPWCNEELVISGIDGSPESAYGFCVDCGDVLLSKQDIEDGLGVNRDD